MKNPARLLLPATAALLLSAGAASAAADPADWRPSERWRGFNLLEMFYQSGAGAPPRDFREEDFRFMRDNGFNFARLPMDYRFWIKDGDWNRIDDARLAYVDRAVELGRRYGVHVCLCFHRAPGYTVANPPEKASIFKDDEALRVCAKHWAHFARRYRGVPNERLSFNLFNEPASVSEADYVRVARVLIDAIRREDPSRFIIADGLDYGNRPVESLAGVPGLGQSTRGYSPFNVSHYLAPWAGTPRAEPVWPLSPDAPNGILAGRGKPDLRAAFAVSNLPPCRVEIGYGRVSGRVKVTFSADGETVAEETLEPAENDRWADYRWYPEWNLAQATYLGRTSFALPKGARRLEAKVTDGDWLGLATFTVTAPDGKSAATLRFLGDWGRPRNFVQTFRGFGVRRPFASAETGAVRYEDPGMEYLYRNQILPWEKLAADGTFVMTGEFGVWKMTPHPVALEYLEDYLRHYKERGWGWSLWELRGAFGVMDSDRKDVEYEDWHGHKLDRRMLDLLRKY